MAQLKITLSGDEVDKIIRDYICQTYNLPRTTQLTLIWENGSGLTISVEPDQRVINNTPDFITQLRTGQF